MTCSSCGASSDIAGSRDRERIGILFQVAGYYKMNSSKDDRWTFTNVLMWIATRSFIRTENNGATYVEWIDRNLVDMRGSWLFLPPGPTATDADADLWARLERGEIAARASRVLLTYSLSFEHGLRIRELIDEKVENQIGFQPPNDCGLLRRLEKIPESMNFRERPAPNPTQEIDWRDLTFARSDVLRLWPEHPQTIAYRLATAMSWTPPAGVDKASLILLPEGERVALDPIVNLMAFGQVEGPTDRAETEILAAKICAGGALIAAARDGIVGTYGTPALPRDCLSEPLVAAGPRERIAPTEFDNAALTLSYAEKSAFCASDVAANYAEKGGHPDAVKWFGVTVERKSLANWLETRITDRNGPPKNKGGRPRSFDWPMIEQEAIRLMDYHGDFVPDDATWNAQARLEAALQEFCTKRFELEPASSTLRGRLRPWLNEWRDNKVHGQKPVSAR
jgi:hypothetical protein